MSLILQGFNSPLLILQGFGGAGADGPATALTMTPPAGLLRVGRLSGNFTVTPDGSWTGTVTPDDGAAGGTFTPDSLTWDGSSAAQTFRYTPATLGLIVISVTNDGFLDDPEPVEVTVVESSDSGVRPDAEFALGFGEDWL